MNPDRIYSMLVPALQPLAKGHMGRARRHHFEAVRVPPQRVVFLGDSIIEGGLWADLFPDLPTSNRGIAGEATYDLAKRLDSAINAPVAVSLMIGTNDLHGPRRLRDIAEIASRAEDIVRQIRERAPDAKILVNSVLPRTELFAQRIRDLNERYREMVARQRATYVDLWPRFAEPSGVLRSDYTTDGLHLAPAGYLVWAELLRPHLAPFATGAA